MALAEGGGGFAVVRARLPSAQRYYIEQAAICQRQTWPGTDVRGPQCFQLVKPHPSRMDAHSRMDASKSR